MKLTHILTAVAASGLALSVPAFAVNLDAAQKTQVEGIVHDYILQHPQVIIEAVNSLQKAEFEKMQKKSVDAAMANMAPLFHQANDPVIGNLKGKVTLVEFFDYQCPHCVEMDPVIDGLIKANPELRIVMKDFPIRGPVSLLAAKAAIAANLQGKYLPFHQGLMKQAEGLTEDKIYTIAKDLGLNVDKLKADMNSAAVDVQIKDTYKLAQALQLMGTPVFFLAKTDLPKGASSSAIQFIGGQVDQKTLQADIDTAARS